MKNEKRSKNAALARAALLALALMPTIVSAQNYSDVKNNGPLHFRGYGTFFMTGSAISVDAASQAPARQPGLVVINQMHVQFMLPQAQNEGDEAADHDKKHVP